MKVGMADDTIAWLGVRTDSRKVKACLKTVIREMPERSQLALRDKRLQIEVVPDSWGMGEVWAYFPVHRRRLIAKRVRLKATTRVLLVICTPGVERRPLRQTEHELRHHIGHVVRYLRDPRSPNECVHAEREWKKCTT